MRRRLVSMLARRDMRTMCMRFATHQPLRSGAGNRIELGYLLSATRAPHWEYRISWHGRVLVARELTRSAFERTIQARITLMLRKIATPLYTLGRSTPGRGRAAMSPALAAAALYSSNRRRWPTAAFRRGEPSRLVRNVMRMATSLQRFGENTGIDVSRVSDLQSNLFFPEPDRVKRSSLPGVVLMRTPLRAAAFPGLVLKYLQFRLPRGNQVLQRLSVLLRSLSPALKQGRQGVARSQARTALEVVGMRQAVSVLQRRHRFDGSVPPQAGHLRFVRVPAERMRKPPDTRWIVSTRNLLPAGPRALSFASAFPWRWDSKLMHARTMWPSLRAVTENRYGHALGLRRRAQEHTDVVAASPVALPSAHEPTSTRGATQASLPTVTLAYRETPARPELHLSKHVQRIEQHITRKIVQEIAQATPWRADVEKTVLTPRVVRELAEQVTGLMTQRIGLERYRRGL